MLLCRVPAWRSVAKGAVTSVRCLAGLWVGDLWSSKHVPYSEVLLGYAGSVETVGTRPTGDCRCWRENRGWYSCPWEVSRLGELELLGDEWVSNEG